MPIMKCFRISDTDLSSDVFCQNSACLHHSHYLKFLQSCSPSRNISGNVRDESGFSLRSVMSSRAAFNFSPPTFTLLRYASVRAQRYMAFLPSDGIEKRSWILILLKTPRHNSYRRLIIHIHARVNSSLLFLLSPYCFEVVY